MEPAQGTVNYAVASQTSQSDRTGAIDVQGQALTVRQTGTIAYTASVTQTGTCYAHTTCGTCQLTANHNVPSPHTFNWDLGRGIVYTTTSNVLSGPDWKLYCPDSLPGQFPVQVSVTVMGSAGTAVGTGTAAVTKT